MINQEWLSCLSKKIEEEYGVNKRDEILLNATSICDDVKEIREWFEGLVKRLDKPENREIAENILVDCCPCRCPDIEDSIGKCYEGCDNLNDFAKKLKQQGLFDDHIEIKDGLLIATKRHACECGIIPQYNNVYSTKCHCALASIVNEPISKAFCYCGCGFYKKMFKEALGIDVKVDLISAVIAGDDVCSVAIHIPEKSKNGVE